MKFAIVDDIKTEAFKGGNGICPCCKYEVISKCGEQKINHWAHKSTKKCDTWWENETKWHREWKNKFPIDWQEIVHFDIKGEKHVADVKTKTNWVIEFQHSYTTSEERNSRNNFYSKLIWVIDGIRRKTDIIQFKKKLKESTKAPVGGVEIRQINFPEESRILREWMNSGAPVFFDFGELANNTLWFLLPLNFLNEAYLLPFSKIELINVLNQEGFDELINKLIPNIQTIITEYKKKQSNNRLSYRIKTPNRRRFKRRL